MTTLTRKDINICNVKNNEEIDFLIQEAEQEIKNGGVMLSFEELLINSEKMIESLGKDNL